MRDNQGLIEEFVSGYIEYVNAAGYRTDTAGSRVAIRYIMENLPSFSTKFKIDSIKETIDTWSKKNHILIAHKDDLIKMLELSDV